MVIEFKESQPKWRQIAEILAGRIRDGTYPPGSKIPTVLEIVREFEVANRTAQKALRALREQGLITTEPGMGSFVAEDDETPDRT